MIVVSRKNGFSLVELLTVIAIIAILAAVIFPVMGVVKNRAQMSACSSNLMQIANGVKMYKTDNRVYPVALAPAISTGTGSGSNYLPFDSAQSPTGLFAVVRKDDQAVPLPYVEVYEQGGCRGVHHNRP